jgi:hypothetical protein
MLMRVRPGDLDEPAGGLNALPDLDFVAMELGLLVHSFFENATTELLKLPATVLPENLKRFDVTNVKLDFLNRVASLYDAPERQDVFGQLMASLPCCDLFIVETYEKPSQETLNTFKLIDADPQDMEVNFELWLQNEDDMEDVRLI